MEQDLGILLRKMRLIAGFTQDCMADLMHTTTGTISKMENGVKNVRVTELFEWTRTTHGQEELRKFLETGGLLVDSANAMPAVVSFILPFVA